MFTDYIWVLGLFLSVGAGAFLWINHMNTFATPGDTSDAREGETQTTPKPVSTMHRYQAMPSLSPMLPVTNFEVVESTFVDVVEEEVVLDVETPEISDIPDDEDVEVKLKLADQLQVIGDFEGVTEYAEMVLADSKASKRQQERAQILLRLDNNF